MKIINFSLLVFTVIVLLFITMSIETNAQSCDCTEYIYLNEPGADATLKFRVNADGTLTEVINPATPNGHWQEGTTIFPHGLGSDLNGFLYVGNIDGNPANGGVDKYDCAGTLIQEDAIPPATGDGTTGVSGYATNIYSIGNTLYMNSWPGSGYFREIFAYDICTGDILGSYKWCEGSNAWDFHINEEDNTIYINTNTGVHIADLDAYLNGDCIPLTFTDNTNRGIVVDENGFIYVRDQSANILRKYDPNGNLLWEIDVTINGGGAGWGLVYSEETGYLYLAGNDADCIAVYDSADGSYVVQGAANNGGAATKAIGITKECCPSPTNLVIDTFLCLSSTDNDIFLQELLNCDGVICEGGWTADPANTGLTFNDCNNSVRLSGNQACGSFDLFSDGSGALSQCGQFSITVNIEAANIVPATVSGDQTICATSTGSPLTATSSTTGVTYQWQMSTTDCTTGFTDIAGATAATYTPTGLATTTYYRVVTSISGGCSTGTCQETSNCVTVTTEPCYDLRLGKTADATTANIGDPVTYTLTVYNEGIGDMTGVEVTDILPSNLTYTGDSSGGSYDPATGIWMVGTVAEGDSAVIEIYTTISAAGVISNSAEITAANEIDLDSAPGDGITAQDDLGEVCLSVPVQICETETINIELIAPTGYTNYQWYKDGALISGETANIYVATDVGSYVYTLDGVGPGDCMGELCCPVVIERIDCCPPVQCAPISITITPNN